MGGGVSFPFQDAKVSNPHPGHETVHGKAGNFYYERLLKQATEISRVLITAFPVQGLEVVSNHHWSHKILHWEARELHYERFLK